MKVENKLSNNKMFKMLCLPRMGKISTKEVKIARKAFILGLRQVENQLDDE